MKKVLVVAVHPDDETFGCGGALLKHVANGDDLYWLIITNVSEKYGFAADYVAKRQSEIEKVGQLYGFKEVMKLDYPTMRLDTVPIIDMVSKITEYVKKVSPEVIYLPNKHDVHSDHRICFEVAYPCTKSFRFKSVREILMYECVSESEYAPPFASHAFVPNYFCDITDYIEKKLEIIKTYESELSNHPFPRSIDNIKALSMFRGATCGCRYAEAFVLLKYIC